MSKSIEDAIFRPLTMGLLPAPGAGARVLYAGARTGDGLPSADDASGWVLLQPFKPWADALAGYDLQLEWPERTALFDYVFVLGARQLDEMRGMLAHAALRLKAGGWLVAAAANDAGGKRLAQECAALGFECESTSKHHARIVWGQKNAATFRADEAEERALRAGLQTCQATGLVSCPGLFAWDRVDAGSLLLVQHLQSGQKKQSPKEQDRTKLGRTRPDLQGHDLQGHGLQGHDLTEQDLKAWAATGYGAKEGGAAAKRQEPVAKGVVLKGNGADFGCGTGYLARAIVAANPGIKKIICLDADARAVEACRRNMERFGVERSGAGGSGVAVECRQVDLTRGHDLPTNLDWIVMNPPFHEGRVTESGIGAAFIKNAAAALHRGGVLYMVANSQLPYETALKAHFGVVTKLDEKAGYKIYCAVRKD